jgi:hypothetical protein
MKINRRPRIRIAPYVHLLKRRRCHGAYLDSRMAIAPEATETFWRVFPGNFPSQTMVYSRHGTSHTYIRTFGANRRSSQWRTS